MSDISEDNKKMLAYAEEVFGEASSIDEFWDEQEENSIDVMSVEDAPDEGIGTYITLGLSDVPTGLVVDDLPVGVELVMAGDAGRAEIPNILVTCALNVLKDNFEIMPGVIFADVCGMYLGDSPMKHILFVQPFLWDIETQDLDEKKVAWLQAVPISDAEMKFADEKGTEALEDLFEEKQIDVYDLDRPSVV